MFIKKTLGLLVSSVICFTGLSNAAIVFDNGKVSANTDGLSSYSNAVLGDIDNNGKINSIDLSMARKGMIEGFQTNYARKSFDVDGDTQASISDLFLLKNII